MNAPNFCEPCGRYHSRDYRDCVRRLPASVPPPATQVPLIRDSIVPSPPEASNPAYVTGWRHGYQAALADMHGRNAA